jgi:hypothetical protein
MAAFFLVIDCFWFFVLSKAVGKETKSKFISGYQRTKTEHNMQALTLPPN